MKLARALLGDPQNVFRFAPAALRSNLSVPSQSSNLPRETLSLNIPRETFPIEVLNLQRWAQGLKLSEDVENQTLPGTLAFKVLGQVRTLGVKLTPSKQTRGTLMASRPIRNYEDLYLFLSILKEKHSLYGDFATVQFQWGLRFQTAQSLTVGDVRKCLRNGSVLLVENKTGKKRACGLNDKVKEIFLKYVSENREDGEVLWGRTIVRETYNLKLKEIGLMLGWDVAELSSHSLRKSFAYHLRTKFNVPVEKISEQMNHASVRTTLIYAGLAEDEKVAITQLGL